MNPVLEQVTQSLIRRSQTSRRTWLAHCSRAATDQPPVQRLSCGNLAHAVAACQPADKSRISGITGTAHCNIGIVTAYNDILSAHQPYGDYPRQLREYAAVHGATTQVASGVPAMCDGVTQGQPGMELSLFSRDVVALSTAVGLSHNVFQAHALLGICDKIVPGLLMGALQFGHIPALFLPSGPMPSGLSNPEKARTREQYAAGKIDRAALFASESAAYHAAGTCTFYGTANTNQIMLEALGVQLPGSSFVPPGTSLREALNRHAMAQLVHHSLAGEAPRPLSEVITAEAIINAVVALLATGGSTNHTIHLVAIARCAGIELSWQDMHQLSSVVPLLTRIYPNGDEDVNAFHQRGGTVRLFAELRRGRLLNEQVVTMCGDGLDALCQAPNDDEGTLTFSAPIPLADQDPVIRSITTPFSADGGLKVLEGNLGRAVIKVSAVKAAHRVVQAPCRVFETQEAFVEAFNLGELFTDVIVVLRFHGPACNGMPELHKLTPFLALCQNRGHAVALLTDGRMSGASGKVPAAIHLCPEAAHGGLINRLVDGDLLRLDAETGQLDYLGDEDLSSREEAATPTPQVTLGRGLFALPRRHACPADHGGSFLLEARTDDH